MQGLLVVGSSVAGGDGSSLQVLIGGVAVSQAGLRSWWLAGLFFFFFLKDFSSSVNTFEHFEDCHLHSSAGLCFRIFVSVFSKAGAGKKLASEPIAWCFILLLHEHSA